MSGDDKGFVGGTVGHELQKLCGVDGIEVLQGFVEQKEIGVACHGEREGDPLSLSRRKPSRTGVMQRDKGLREARDPWIVHVGTKPVPLSLDTDIVKQESVAGTQRRGGRRRVECDVDVPGIRGEDAGDEFEQGRVSGSVGGQNGACARKDRRPVIKNARGAISKRHGAQSNRGIIWMWG